MEANADQRALQDLKDKVNNAALDYSDYVNQADYNALLKTIDDWSWKVNRALDKSLNDGTPYKTPWTANELAALEQTIDNFVQSLADAKEADANQQRLEELTKQANGDRQILQTLKDKVEKANLDYSAYVNKTEYNAMIKTIDEWSRKINQAINDALSNGTDYKTPWTSDELAALEQTIDNFVQRLADAKEADVNQQKVEEITKQANADREKVQNLRHEWEEVLSELNKQYPGFTLAFDKANIDTKFSKISSDIDAAQKKAVEELGTYASPKVDDALSEIRGLIQKYKTDVETEVNRIKHNAEEAANADRTTVANARQIAENAINATDTKYPAFANEADRSDIYSRYDKLMSDIDAAEKNATDHLATYASPSVAQALVEIDALVTKYQREVAAAAEAAKTEATKLADADKATLSSLADEIEVISSKYGPMSCIDTQKLKDLNSAIQELRGKIDTAVNNVYTVGSYQTPLTESELQKIRDEISALEADCNTRLVAAIDKAAKADLDKVSNLKTQYDNLIESLEKEYPAFRDLDKEAAIADLFDNITENINEAAAKAKSDKELYVSPDVDNYLKNTITAQMNAYNEEVLKNASGTMSKVEQAAQTDKKTLDDLKSELEQARNEYADYLQYVDETTYDDLCDRIEDWKTKVEEAKEDAKQTGEYSTPWNEDELTALQNDANGFIDTLKNEKELTQSILAAAQADRTAFENAQKEAQSAINHTDQEYPAFVEAEDKKEVKAAIEQKFNELSEDIDQAKQEALEQRTPYVSPSVSEQLTEIESMVNKYWEDVYMAVNEAINEGQTKSMADHEQLADYKSQVESTYDTYNELGCDTDGSIYQNMSQVISSIETLEGLIETALENLMSVGYYETPLTSEAIGSLEYKIRLFVEACKDQYKTLVEEYVKADQATVKAKQDEYLDFNADVHKVDGLHWDEDLDAMEKGIEKLFSDIQKTITDVANNAIKNAQPYNNEEVQSLLQAIDDAIKAYKQVLIDQIIENDAYALKEGETTLHNTHDAYYKLYEEFFEGYDALEQELQGLIAELNQAGENAILDSGVEYVGSRNNEQIKDVLERIHDLEEKCRDHHFDTVQNDANNYDLIKLNQTKERFEALIKSLDEDSTYNDSRDYNMEDKIASMLEELREEIDQEVKDAIDNYHAYNPIETLDKDLEDINLLIEAYEKKVTGGGEEGLTDEEIDSLVAIDYEVLIDLESHLYYIHNNYEEYLDMEMYNLLCDILNELFNRLEEARKEAYETHQYSTPWDNGEILDLEIAINNLEREAQEKESEQNGISNVEADPETEAIFYDLNGRQIQNPAPGKIYIRVLGGKAQKVVL